MARSQYTAAGQHNGNIGAIDWKSAGDTDLKTYTYSYDKVNRLTAAVFDNANGTTYDNDYDMSATYDANGNILTLNRKGRVLNTAEDIDLLSYTYAANSNQLTKVTDTGDAYDIGDFKDGTNTGDDYSYDANGNLTKDENKDITAISYNQLNLPELITFTGNRSISFVYDAAGIKLQKIKNDNGVLTTTDYISGFIYEGNNLQHFAHEEGRVRKNDAGSLVYDYVIKDHLGNARSTFTTETAPALIYKATMESDNDLDGNNIKAYEETLFYNLENSRVSLPTAANVSTTSDDQCTNCNESAAVNGQTNPIGPAIILDVMAGDEIDLEVWAYRSENVTTSTGTISQANFIDALTEAFTPGGVASELGMQTEAIFNPIYTSLRGGSGSGSTLPKAYLNYVVFNQNFVKQTQGHQPVNGSLNISSLISLNNINITQKGYIYIWVSNESDANLDVFFDDLKVTHTKGHILQEDHYYPFGMNINALSSSAALSKPNRFKYNGKELQSDFDLGWYDYGARFYDPTIGKWNAIDPMSEVYLNQSPYHYALNNPVRYLDPNGMYSTEQWKKDHGLTDDDFTSLEVASSSSPPNDNERAKQEATLFQLYTQGSDLPHQVSNQMKKAYDDLNFLRAQGGQDIVDFFAEMVLSGTLTATEVIELIEVKNRMIAQLRGKGMMEIFSPEVVGEIFFMSLGSASSGTKKKVAEAFAKKFAQRMAKTAIVTVSGAMKKAAEMGFKELQKAAGRDSKAMRAFFDSGGKTSVSTQSLANYRELATRMLNKSGGSYQRVTDTARKLHTERIQMIDEAFKLIK